MTPCKPWIGPRTASVIFVGPGGAYLATGIVVFAVFLWFWGAGLAASEFGAPA